MEKDILVNTIADIDVQLRRNEEIYRKYQLKTKDELGPELWDLVSRLGEVSVALMIVRNSCAKELREHYGIIIF